VSRSGASRSVGPGKDANVHAALHPAISSRGRDRDLRPQLVQPRRRRIRDGILYAAAAPPFSRAVPANREIHHRWRHYVDQSLAGGRTGRAAKAIFGAHQRSAEAVEAEPDGYRIIPALV